MRSETLNPTFVISPWIRGEPHPFSRAIRRTRSRTSRPTAARPGDLLTWFEFAPQAAASFDELLATLRASEEWRHVVREAEIRLTRAGR